MRAPETGVRQPRHPWGFNVIGYISSSLGLAVAARNTIRTLLECGVPVATRDVSSTVRHGGGLVTDFDHLHAEGNVSRYAVNLFHLNPPEILRLAHEAPQWLDMHTCLNVCVPFWELPRLPRPWLPALRAMDAILAPTRFILHAARRDVPNVPSFLFPQAVFLTEDVRSDRPRWTIPDEATVFITSFDANSDFERKNPWAAIKAFDLAFPPEAPKAPKRRPMLVVKVATRGLPEGQVPILEELRSHVASRPGVRLIEEHLSYSDVLSLYASCDAIVSLHRSEGLGLVLMEAMALGKPVIATAWSGNTDFMTARNSFPVPYTLVPAHGSQTQYRSLYVGRNVQWAEPDIHAAADRMRLVAERPDLGRRVGDRAARDMARRQTPAARVGFLEEVQRLNGEFTRAEPPFPAATRNARLGLLPLHHIGYRGTVVAFSKVRAWARIMRVPFPR